MTKKYAYQGEELTLKQIAYKTGISANLLRQRMTFYGHTLESAIACGVPKRGNITRVRNAAPQLLEALKQVMRPYGMHDLAISGASGAMQDEMLKVGKLIRAAIALAEGEREQS